MAVPTIADAVTLRPDQMILPPEEFPLAGYNVDQDERFGTGGWTREWRGTGAFFWIKVEVIVLDPAIRARTAIAATTCDWSFTPPALSGAEIAARVVGDGAKVCSYDFIGQPAGSLVYTTGSRNILVTVGVSRMLASQAAATEFVASLADYQLWIVDRVAPGPTVAVRPAPQVPLPSGRTDVSPQPAARSFPPQATLTPGIASIAPTAAPVAASLVYVSVACGTRTPNQYAAKGYLVQGYVAHFTATGPVGTSLQLVSTGKLDVLDWTGTADFGFSKHRTAGDPASTAVTLSFDLSWDGVSGVVSDPLIDLWIPGKLQPVSESFHLFC